MTQRSTTEPQFLDLCEVPPAGSGKIKDYVDTSFLCGIRHWLIQRLAGKHCVIVNARIGIINRIEDRNVVGRTTNTGDGLLMHNSYIYCDDDRMLLLSNNAA